MKGRALLVKTVKDNRTATIAVAAVAALMALFDILLFPSYQETLKNFEIPDAFKSFLGEAGSIATPEGFIAAEFFSWIPLVLITVAIIGGTATVAGEEAAGTLDLLLAQPISRTQLLVERTAGIAVCVSAAALAAYPALLFGKVFVDFDIGPMRLFAATVNMLPVTFLFLGLATLGSATLPTRSAAGGFAVGAVVVAYFLNAIGGAIDFLDQARKLSPFYWSDGGHVLVGGFDWLRAGGLVALAAILLAVACAAFERRDISTGRREWSLTALARRMRGIATL